VIFVRVGAGNTECGRSLHQKTSPLWKKPLFGPSRGSNIPLQNAYPDSGVLLAGWCDKYKADLIVRLNNPFWFWSRSQQNVKQQSNRRWKSREKPNQTIAATNGAATQNLKQRRNKALSPTDYSRRPFLAALLLVPTVAAIEYSIQASFVSHFITVL